MAHYALRDYAMPNLDAMQGNINRPTINTNNFEIKPTMIQIIQNIMGVLDAATDLRFVPFSLCDDAFMWLDLFHHKVRGTRQPISCELFPTEQDDEAEDGHHQLLAARGGIIL
ncbi:hypothetical protein EPI10_029458 [Gossypium australe]|uniref:Uncharacterized protein n=1 Tax=Gossypium australe TaxID=47621 RepID=A0A5B6V1K0_9ROSI|nr:hypothetical protein EPI10_029458 [Gossypium australe]